MAALKNLTSFHWDKLLAKIENPEVKRSVNILRGKANEITSNAAKYQNEPEKISFDSYKKKLKFTSSAVESLESVYKSKSLPVYHAALPAFEAKKREMMLSVVKNIVTAASADLKELNSQLNEFEKIRISKETSVGDLNQRFPHLAREVEKEIKNHEWSK